MCITPYAAQAAFCAKFCGLCISLGVSVVTDTLIPKRPLSLKLHVWDVHMETEQACLASQDLGHTHLAHVLKESLSI